MTEVERNLVSLAMALADEAEVLAAKYHWKSPECDDLSLFAYYRRELGEMLKAGQPIPPNRVTPESYFESEDFRNREQRHPEFAARNRDFCRALRSFVESTPGL